MTTVHTTTAQPHRTAHPPRPTTVGSPACRWSPASELGLGTATAAPAAPLRAARDQLERLLRGRAARLRPAAGAGRLGLPAAGLAGAAADPLRRDVSYGELAGAHRQTRRRRAPWAWPTAGTRLPVIVPCHRVIGADGSLTGFGGGLERKRRAAGARGGPDGAGRLTPLRRRPPPARHSRARAPSARGARSGCRPCGAPRSRRAAGPRRRCRRRGSAPACPRPRRAGCGVLDGRQQLDARVEVARHQVGRADEVAALVAALEAVDARVLEEAADDRDHADVVADARRRRPAGSRCRAR